MLVPPANLGLYIRGGHQVCPGAVLTDYKIFIKLKRQPADYSGQPIAVRLKRQSADNSGQLIAVGHNG